MKTNNLQRINHKFFFAILLLLCSVKLYSQNPTTVVTGEQKMWHKVTLTFDGPMTSETATTNPFTGYRLDVTFTQGTTTYLVPGYYAADGNAANTSANSGNKWRVHFSPPSEGVWNYSVSFRSGTNIHAEVSPLAGLSAGFMDGETGTINILPTDKTGRDMRAKGWLEYVGEGFLKFKGSGEYFIKQGSDSPENLLSYADFDGDFKTDGKKDSNVKTWQPHIQDWKTGDPTWGNGNGKGLIGAINYLASEGLNSFSFLTMNINGDDQNVFPYINYTTYDRIDVSRMDQWEIVFEHGTKMGMFLHFKTGETENQTLLDNGDTGIQRKLYYRELIARFGHNPALNWNMGEENGTWSNFTVPNGNAQSTAQRKSMAQYMWDTDPYKHHIVAHNGQNPSDLYGNQSKYTGWSKQTNNADFSDSYSGVKDVVDKAAAAGKVWAVALDEPGDASLALRPDSDPGNSHVDGRKNGIWGTFMAGGWGNEWYFGYQKPNSDLTLQDFRSRDNWWDYCRVFLEFFNNNNIPFSKMTNATSKVGTVNWAREKAGEVFVIYLPNGGTTDLDLGTSTSNLYVKWYNPRIGGALQDGTVLSISGTGKKNIGQSPSLPTEDWVVLVYKNECTNNKNIEVTATGCIGASSAGAGVYCVGTSASVTAIPGTTCKFDNWTENGTIVSESNPYTFVVSHDRQLVANFSAIVIPQYIITASAGANGTITPSGSVVVNSGASQSFAIAANPGYEVNAVTVNGVNQGAINSYTFNNVSSNQSIAATFKLSTTINAYSQIQAESYSSMSGVQVQICSEGGQNVSHIVNGSYIVFNNVDFGTGASNFEARVATNTVGGTIELRLGSPTGTLVGTCSVINTGGWQVWTSRSCAISGASGIQNLYLIFKGNTGYLLNVNWFKFVAGAITYTITASAEPNGTITPSGSVEVNSGASQSFAIAASPGYEVAAVTVNGVNQGAISSYTFNNVTANQTISATFKVKQYTITSSAGPNGTITPSGSVVVNSGASQSFAIAANPGYEVDVVTVNGVSQGAISSYTFNNVIANQTISATFKNSDKPVTALTGWISGNTNNKVAGSNRMMVVMVMGEHATSTFSATGVTYGGQAMTKVTERVNGTTYRTYAAIFTLKESGVNAATSGAVNVRWSATPGGFIINSVLLSNVDQTTPVSAFANNALRGTSITTTAMAAGNGDMVIMCGATENNVVQTFNNGFTKRFESNTSWGDGVGGEKMGVGVNETPKFTQSATGRMVICAIVAKKSTSAPLMAPSIANDLNSNSSDKTIRIYPNPVANILNINFPTSEVSREIKVFNAVGQMQYIVQTMNSNVQINVSTLNLKGIALIQVNDGNSVVKYKVMVK